MFGWLVFFFLRDIQNKIMIRSFSKCLLCGLLVLLFAIFSCSREEDFVRQHHHKNNVSIQKKSFQELMKTEMFSKAYGKVANTKLQLRNAGRTALEDEFDFTIVEYAPISIVTDTTGWVTYNILIKKGPEEDLKFHNLVLKTKLDETVAAILKYELVEKAEKSEHDDTYKMDFSDIKVTPLPLEDQEKLYPCGTISMWICCNTTNGGIGPWHAAGEGCTNSNHMQVIWINVMCDDGSDGIPTGPTGGSGGGTGENPDNDYDPQDPDIHGNPPPDITAPVIEEEEIEDEGCEKLNELMQNPAFANAINSNQSDANNADHETGFSAVKNDQDINITPISSTDNDCNVLNFTPGLNWIGFIHCHPSGCDNITRMFSGQDILKLVEIFDKFGTNQAAAAAHKEFFVIMSSSLGTYAVKISNYFQFTAFISQNKLNTDAGRESFVKKFYNLYNARATLFNSQEKDNATSFLTFVNQLQMGLGLYKLNNNNVWNEMKIVNSQAVSQPCN